MCSNLNSPSLFLHAFEALLNFCSLNACVMHSNSVDGTAMTICLYSAEEESKGECIGEVIVGSITKTDPTEIT